VALGLYLVGPLWTPARYRIDAAGVARRTPFGALVLPWDALDGFAVARDGTAAWLWRRGRGTARFLPPVLLLWDEAAAPGTGSAVETALGARLPRRDGSAR